MKSCHCKKRSAAKAVTAAALVIGGGMLAGEASAAMHDAGFSFLGTGREVRSSLIERQGGATGIVYGANHEEKPAGEGKCGEGKCGESKKGGEGKCGEGKCGEGHKEGKGGGEGKCGEGKCGE